MRWRSFWWRGDALEGFCEHAPKERPLPRIACDWRSRCPLPKHKPEPQIAPHFVIFPHAKGISNMRVARMPAFGAYKDETVVGEEVCEAACHKSGIADQE